MSAPQQASARTWTASATWTSAARLWLLVSAFVAVGTIRSVQVGIPFRDPHGAVLTSRIALTAAVFVGLVALDGLLRNDGRRTLPRVWTTIRERWTAGRITLAWAALLAYHLTYLTYRNLKSWDVLNAPRDAMLTEWDRWLFLGHSPAVLLHDLLGQHAAAWVLTAWYQSFGTLVILSFPAAVVLATRMRDALVGIAASPGSGFWHGDLLPDPLVGALPRRARRLRRPAGHGDPEHPGSLPGAARPPARPPARPRRLRPGLGVRQPARRRHGDDPRAGVVAPASSYHHALAVFLAGTMVATVYLGWHFAVDVLPAWRSPASPGGSRPARWASVAALRSGARPRPEQARAAPPPRTRRERRHR